ncbi:MAG TPA: 50S ribosomal protein L25 [Firmicutes bacterium]|jgi:large subunit ribosomal protein L25|nr:50S ribosomal protein L25 [Bacillota bacterium]HAA34084.1 50S ribosomal protein L25 [Bacillota bacterium]
MERIKIEAFPREKATKGSNRQLRSKGMIPGVVYGRGAESRKITLEASAFRRAVAAGSNVVLDLQLKGGNGTSIETVMVKEVQRHPLQRDFFLHVDLLRISLDEKLEIRVPLSFTGDPKGVKEGGIFQAQMREINVRCLPADIPEYINVPVEELGIGDVLTVGDIKLPEGMEMLEDENENVASVLAPHAEVIEEAEKAEEEETEEKEEKPEEAQEE